MTTRHPPSTWLAIKEYLTPPFIVPVTILLTVILFYIIHEPLIPGPL